MAGRVLEPFPVTVCKCSSPPTAYSPIALPCCQAGFHCTGMLHCHNSAILVSTLYAAMRHVLIFAVLQHCYGFATLSSTRSLVSAQLDTAGVRTALAVCTLCVSASCRLEWHSGAPALQMVLDKAHVSTLHICCNTASGLNKPVPVWLSGSKLSPSYLGTSASNPKGRSSCFIPKRVYISI